jgi:hypothetical protein
MSSGCFRLGPAVPFRLIYLLRIGYRYDDFISFRYQLDSV